MTMMRKGQSYILDLIENKLGGMIKSIDVLSCENLSRELLS